MKRIRILSRFLTVVICLLLSAAGCAPSGEEPAKLEVKPAEQAPELAVEVAKPPEQDEEKASEVEIVKPEVEPEEQIPPVATSPRHGGEEAPEIIKPEVELPPQLSAKAEAGVELTLKFTQEDSTTYKVITEAQRIIKGEGALLDESTFKGGITSNRIEMTFTQQIQSVDAQGNAVAKITIDKLKYSAKVKDKVTTDFDSSLASLSQSEREKDQNSSLYKLIGQSYTIEITPAGQVSKIIDCSQVQAAVEGNPADSQAASILLEPDAIKLRHTIPALSITDKNQVRIGDSWSNVKPFSFGMMGSKSYERIYTLKKIEDVDNRRIAVVQMNAIPSSETTEELHKEQAMDIFSKMFDNIETYTGGLKLDLNAGKTEEYFEKLQSEWVAVDPSAGQKADIEPAALRMTATRFHRIEKID